MLEAGIRNIVRWLPFRMPEDEVADRICTKMIHPTSTPQNPIDLQIEQALATEALRLAFEQHKQIATAPPKETAAWRSLVGGKQMTQAKPDSRSIVNLENIDMLVGSGGALSHAPRRAQAALMMLNAFLPRGVTYLAVDSVFMMPHLGVLSQIHPQAALNVLEKDCFIPLGPVIALDGVPDSKMAVVTVHTRDSGGRRMEATVNAGDISVLPTAVHGEVTVEATAFGSASIAGRPHVQFTCRAGEVGVIIDARGRPFSALGDADSAEANARWSRQIGAFDSPGGDEYAR